MQLADLPLARELICGCVKFMDTLARGECASFRRYAISEPGFTLEGASAYAIATDRYIRDTGDDQIVEEPILADTLYLSSDDLAARRDKTHPLYHTEVTLSGTPVAYPFTLHGNAVVAYALDCLKRTID